MSLDLKPFRIGFNGFKMTLLFFSKHMALRHFSNSSVFVYLGICDVRFWDFRCLNVSLIVYVNFDCVTYISCQIISKSRLASFVSKMVV